MSGIQFQGVFGDFELFAKELVHALQLRVDAVVCIQNGISAFHVNPLQLISEGVRVTRPGGVAIFSSYAASFWEERLNWFRLQAAEGLLGAIDEDRTKDGVIVCHDGFTATTVGSSQFRQLTASLNALVMITEVDNSSLFCEIRPK